LEKKKKKKKKKKKRARAHATIFYYFYFYFLATKSDPFPFSRMLLYTIYEQAPEATHGFPGPLLLPPAVMALVQTAVFLTDFGAIRVRVWASSQLESRPLFFFFFFFF
jgi:hypothetical protein